MKILVCGSRKWTDEKRITKVLTDIIEPWPLFADEPTIIHGGAKGADKLAADVATLLGFWVEEHLPDYDKYPARIAPLKRNLEMLDREPDLVLAFQVGKSRGTQHTINHARKRGIPVKVYNG